MNNKAWFTLNIQVYGLGESEDSKKWLKENNGSLEALFLSHVTKVCHFLAELRPGIKPIFWEDMLRKIGATLIKGMPWEGWRQNNEAYNNLIIKSRKFCKKDLFSEPQVQCGEASRVL